MTRPELGTNNGRRRLNRMKIDPPNSRFRALDSLRGLAALLVVYTHICQVVPAAPSPLNPYLALPSLALSEAGPFAVMIFFVLSGFVLSLPNWRGKNKSYAPFIAQRFSRLYLPYAFAVLVAAILCWALTNPPASSLGWTLPVSPRIVGEHLLMTGIGPESTMLDRPMWTLIIEMRISLIFPLLFLAVRRFGWPALVVGVIAAFACCKINAWHGAQGETGSRIGTDTLGTLLLTGRYIPLFLFGIFTAGRLETVKRVLSSLPMTLHAAICVSIVLLHTFMVTRELQYHGYGDIIYGIMATYLVASCVTFAGLSRRLSGRLFLWLGDVSYSLYLIHVPVLYAVINVLQKQFGYGMAITVAVPLIFVSAQLMYRWVELPSVWLGRKFAERLSRKNTAQMTLAQGQILP